MIIIIRYIISKIENSQYFRNHLCHVCFLLYDPFGFLACYLDIFKICAAILLISPFLFFFASLRTCMYAYEARARYKSNIVPCIPSVAKDRSAFRIAIWFLEDNGRYFNRSLQTFVDYYDLSFFSPYDV